MRIIKSNQRYVSGYLCYEIVHQYFCLSFVSSSRMPCQCQNKWYISEKHLKKEKINVHCNSIEKPRKLLHSCDLNLVSVLPKCVDSFSFADVDMAVCIHFSNLQSCRCRSYIFSQSFIRFSARYNYELKNSLCT